ncbi:MAG: response regulator [Planctomycetota bacterium]|jgi:CheY-like chemotaxis protein/DNA-directed RNA polymerase subunit RPC12/RpoP
MRKAVVTCNECGASLRASEDKVGKAGKCPYCGATVVIPAFAFTAPQQAPAKRPVPVLSAQTVLVVDDEPDEVEFARAVMEEAGYEVITARDGKEGLQVALARRPDLVILDLEMPRKSGGEAFREMRRLPELKETPVVILSGAGPRIGLPLSGKDMQKHIGKAPEAYLEKPVDPRKLRAVVDRVLKHIET